MRGHTRPTLRRRLQHFIELLWRRTCLRREFRDKDLVCIPVDDYARMTKALYGAGQSSPRGPLPAFWRED